MQKCKNSLLLCVYLGDPRWPHLVPLQARWPPPVLCGLWMWIRQAPALGPTLQLLHGSSFYNSFPEVVQWEQLVGVTWQNFYITVFFSLSPAPLHWEFYGYFLERSVRAQWSHSLTAANMKGGGGVGHIHRWGDRLHTTAGHHGDWEWEHAAACGGGFPIEKLRPGCGYLPVPARGSRGCGEPAGADGEAGWRTGLRGQTDGGFRGLPTSLGDRETETRPPVQPHRVPVGQYQEAGRGRRSEQGSEEGRGGSWVPGRVRGPLLSDMPELSVRARDSAVRTLLL